MNLVQMSLTAGILIVGIVIFRGLFIHRISKKALILLWEIAILRLVLPFSVPLPFPVIGDLGTITISGARTAVIGGRFSDVASDASDSVALQDIGGGASAAAESGTGVSGMMDSVEEREMTAVSVTVDGMGKSHILWLIYGLVTFSMAAGSLYLYFRDSQLFREALPMPEREKLLLLTVLGEKDRERMRRVSLRISDRTASPVTCGILRPAIVFPKGIYRKTEKEITFWLRHELIHIRHHDNLKKLIAHGVLCIHWFNPLVWLLYILFNRDMELACDEAVVCRGQGSRRDYALALLSMAEQRSLGFQTGLGFGKNAVTERITAVMKFRRVTVAGILGTVMAVALALTAFGAPSASYSVSYPAVSGETTGRDDFWTEDNARIAEYTVTAENMAFADSSPVSGINVVWEDPDRIVGWTVTDITADSVESTAGTLDTAEESYAVVEDAVAHVYTAGESTGDYTVDDAGAAETGRLSEGTGNSIEDIVREYREFGLSVELSGEDYQLYYEGEPVYFFADNTIPEEEGFSGRLLLREPGRRNGLTGVVVRHGQDGEVTGLEQLSGEESEEYTSRWR